MRDGTDDTRDRQRTTSDVARGRGDPAGGDAVDGGTAQAPRRSGRGGAVPPDRVAEASMESFPASDPPSWSGMRVGPPA